MQTNMKLMVSVEEATEILGIGRTVLYPFLTHGELRSLKIGRRRVIPVEALEEFVHRLKVEQGIVPAEAKSSR